MIAYYHCDLIPIGGMMLWKKFTRHRRDTILDVDFKFWIGNRLVYLDFLCASVTIIFKIGMRAGKIYYRLHLKHLYLALLTR